MNQDFQKIICSKRHASKAMSKWRPKDQLVLWFFDPRHYQLKSKAFHRDYTGHEQKGFHPRSHLIGLQDPKPYSPEKKPEEQRVRWKSISSILKS